jgi:hypothetical protein
VLNREAELSRQEERNERGCGRDGGWIRNVLEMKGEVYASSTAGGWR